MEQAVNTFNKGLQTDTHPMILGNDVLSDCLNGTFVTMNGNEIVLQNDMGNRRVNNAFLPPGYLPVGIKEYGGVIYIAAYNPITNKSQIGSFPSPLRKINNEINKDLLGNSFRFGEVLSESNIYNYSLKNIDKEVKFLNNDSFLIPLTTDIVIHAGDKFVVSADKLSENWEYITNYNNTHDLIGGVDNTTKAISPKNRLFTISLGILNSQNEFVDITKTLCRWENKNGRYLIKNYNSSYSDIFKFNDKYFIPDTFNNDSLNETIEDARLIRVRLTIEANTYAYKLIGPLYLKITLNHIETFSFNIYGRTNEEESLDEEQPTNESENDQENESSEELEQTVDFLIEAIITYNCPDGINSSLSDILLDSNGNQDYETFDEGTPNYDEFRVFDFVGPDGTILTPSKITYKKSIYNPSNNLYTLRIIKEYSENYTDSLYNYFIGVVADSLTDEQDPVYLEGLSVEGTIDLDLLGTGLVSGDVWKFYNTVKTNGIDIKLLFGLSVYPPNGHSYKNLRFKFQDLNDSNNIYYGPVSSATLEIRIENEIPLFLSMIDGTIGIGIIQGDYNQSNFIDTEGNFIEPRKAYKVFIYCDDYDNENETYVSMLLLNNKNIWYISTGLFNEFYNNDNIKNFYDVETNPENSGYNEKFAEKMMIKLESMVESNSNQQLSSKNLEGSLISKGNGINFKSINEESATFEYNSSIKIKEEESYPDCIVITGNLSLSKNETQVRFKNTNTIVSYNDPQLDEYYLQSIERSGTLYTTKGNPSEMIFDNLFSITVDDLESNKITVEINHNDLLRGDSNNYIREAKVFSKFFDFVKTNFSELISYHGIVFNYDTNSSSNTHDIIDAPCRLYRYGSRIDDLPGDALGFTNPDYEYYFKYIKEKSLKRVEQGTIGTKGYAQEFSGDGEKIEGVKLTMDLEFDDELGIFCYLFTQPGYPSSLSTMHISSNSNKEPVNGSEFARVWWKDINGKWVLFKDLLEFREKYNEENPNKLYNSEHEYFVEVFLKKEISKDYVYCTNEQYSFNDNSLNKFYSIINNGYKYINQHDITIYLLFKFGITNVNKVLGETYGNLSFLFNENLGTIEEKEFRLRSNDDFYEKILEFENIDEEDISIYIYTKANTEEIAGEIYDSNGYFLNPNKVYYLDDDNKLVLTSLEVMKKTIKDKYPVLLCNNTSKNIDLEYDYDVYGYGSNTIYYDGYKVYYSNNESDKIYCAEIVAV